jgi:hypothetical protein
MNDNLNLKDFQEGRADKLLRETMMGHRVEPNNGLWKGISRKLLWNELIRFNFTNISLKYRAASVAGLLLIAAALYLVIPGSAPEVTVGKPKANLTQVALHEAKLVSANHAAVVVNNRSEQSVSPAALNRTNYGSSPEKSVELPVPAIEPVFSEPALATHELTGLQGIEYVMPYEAILFSLLPVTDTLITIRNDAGVFKFRKAKPESMNFISANLGVTPELAFYDEPEVYSKTNFWLNAGLTWHVSRFSISSGVGFGYVYDRGRYKVEYESLDSIGYFTGVTSYTIGANNEIIYNTQNVNVYDSLQHQDDFRTKNRYAYLQVPLLGGYRFYESNKVSMTFKAGPAVSFLLGSRKSDPVIEYSNATIIRVDEGTPARIQTNWQIWANLYFEMRLNKQVSIYLEPSFKYYFKPMVIQENVNYKAPWTIGLGIGIQLNFGPKKPNP